MSRDPDPLVEITKAIEHLVRAGEGLLGQVLGPFRAAVQAETKRWAKRAVDDPAAARVHEVFRTLLEILQDRCDAESVQLQALQTIAVNGAFEASRAMSKWLKRGVKISTDGFQRVPIQEIAESFDESSPIAAMHSRLGDQLRGHTLLAVESGHAMRLTDLLLDRPQGTTKELGEIEQSCLSETGNILVSSFINSWANWLDMRIEPGVPQFLYDHPRAVIQSALSEQALVGDEGFMARTDFLVDDQWLEWVFMLFPSPSAIRLIETSCA